VQAVGVGRWARFVADALERARDRATVAAVAKSREPPAGPKDAIRPVYPVETATGIAAAALTGGAAAAARAVGGALPRQFLARPVPTIGSESPLDILAPGGQPIGKPGGSEKIRELPGGRNAAGQLFRRLAIGGTDVTPPRYPGTLVQTSNGGYIGYRPQSKSGPPTIDVNQPGLPIDELKFLGD
jgi:hypothetical protein